jgi:hypothetical protein
LLGLMGPKAWFPENVGTTTLPWESVLGAEFEFGTGLWRVTPKMASAVRFLGLPLGPGHETQPSWFSLRSPGQVG